MEFVFLRGGSQLFIKERVPVSTYCLNFLVKNVMIFTTDSLDCCLYRALMSISHNSLCH